MQMQDDIIRNDNDGLYCMPLLKIMKNHSVVVEDVESLNSERDCIQMVFISEPPINEVLKSEESEAYSNNFDFLLEQ